MPSLFQSRNGTSNNNENTGGGILSLLLLGSDSLTSAKEETLSPEMVRRQQALEEGRQQALKVVPSEEGIQTGQQLPQEGHGEDIKKKNDSWMELLRARAKNLKELDPPERQTHRTPQEVLHAKAQQREDESRKRQKDEKHTKAKDVMKQAREQAGERAEQDQNRKSRGKDRNDPGRGIRYQNQHGSTIILLPQDGIYQKGTWDKAPIVLEEYKLLFFTVPKVGCTAFKQLFRRMMGHADWKDHQYYTQPFLPHNPDRNGLKYLSQYPLEKANEMLTSDEWTRAIFVRDPQERVLSGYLDKAGHSQGSYLRMQCCKRLPSGSRAWEAINCSTGKQSYTEPQAGETVTNTPILPFEDFLSLIVPKCTDPHWEPQNTRSKFLCLSLFWAIKKKIKLNKLMCFLAIIFSYALLSLSFLRFYCCHFESIVAPKYWERINFIGRFETVYEDTKRLLEKLGAWEEFGATGWTGKDGQDGAIFDPRQKAQHGTKAQDITSKEEYLTHKARQLIVNYYISDYHSPVLNFQRPETG